MLADCKVLFAFSKGDDDVGGLEIGHVFFEQSRFQCIVRSTIRYGPSVGKCVDLRPVRAIEQREVLKVESGRRKGPCVACLMGHSENRFIGVFRIFMDGEVGVETSSQNWTAWRTGSGVCY